MGWIMTLGMQMVVGLTAARIVCDRSSGPAPLRVTMRAETVGLTHPLQYRWNLGDGREWEGAEPPAQVYRTGRYHVILTVTDAEGHVKKASVTIDSQCRGC